MNKQLHPLTETELVLIFHRNNRLADIVRTIKEIDKQHNGFITTTELDDILKLFYKNELANKDLKHIMKKYASIQNRVLVDYKAFRDSIISQLKLQNNTYTYAATESSLSPQKTIARDSTAKKKTGTRLYEALNKFLESKVDKVRN